VEGPGSYEEDVTGNESDQDDVSAGGSCRLEDVEGGMTLSELDGGSSLIDPGVSTPNEIETDGTVTSGIETVQRRGRIATK